MQHPDQSLVKTTKLVAMVCRGDGIQLIVALERIEVTCLCVCGVCGAPVCIGLPPSFVVALLGPATRRTARACHELTPLTLTTQVWCWLDTNSVHSNRLI